MPNKNIEIVARLETVPSQGIRALVDTVYLYNPEAINQLVDQLNEVIKKVDVGNYNSLEDKPVLRTYSSDSLTPDSGEVIQGIVDLHKISKTGSYNDLNDKPNLGNIAYKDSITNADIADDAGIEKNKLSVEVQESLDKTQSNSVEISIIKTDLDDLGDQVSGIEEKIPESASSINQLATFSDLDSLEQDIRNDMNGKDSELESIITEHADELTTLRGNQAALGDQVSVIESKIPESTTETNHLITKQMLLDEEMDIREDLNETSSELQTQITAQADEVNKLKEAIAGIGSFSYSVVDSLPESGEKGVIYLVPKDGEQPDVHDEYLWVDGQFELIGTTQVDLSNYVQKTDIATSGKAGLLLGVGSGFRANIYGMPQCDSLTTVSYPGVANSYFISKGSIENLKDDIVKRAITANSITLTDAEKTAAKNWLGVVENDVDLSNYVQKTDYASSKAAGLIRGYNANGFGFVPDTGYPYCENKSLASYNSAGGNLFIGKGTLESIKYSYVRDGIAKNTYSLSDSEKEKVRNWIGAGVPTVFDVMPDVYFSVGKTYQYVGETTEEFTSGYFYKCVSQGFSYINSDGNITFDFDLFWSELESAGITLETLQLTEIDKERGGFSIIGTVESVTNYRVQNINGIPLDVLLTQSIRSTSEYVGMSNRWYYKPSETFAWERVDVQPVPEALPDQNGNAGKVLTTDGETASWQEPAVYTRITIKRYN